MTTPAVAARALPLPPPVARGLDLALEATVAGSFSQVGFQVRRWAFAWSPLGPRALEDQVVLVTGGTSGLGRAAATQLAGSGATVVITGRHPDRTEAVAADLRQATANPRVHGLTLDLADLDQVVRAADRLLTDHDRLDVVIHNAGALVHEHQRTVDGLELTAQTHVVAPFVLTRHLFDRLAAQGGGRVITVASGGLYTQALGDLDPGPEHFDGVRAYARAKRAQVVLTQQWARRTQGRGVAFHAMHPGWVDTPGLAEALPGFHARLGRGLRTPDQGADTITWLAGHPDPARPDPQGPFWLDRHRRWVDKLPWTSTSAVDAEDLWKWVADQAGQADQTGGGDQADRGDRVGTG